MVLEDGIEGVGVDSFTTAFLWGLLFFFFLGKEEACGARFHGRPPFLNLVVGCHGDGFRI